MVVMRTNLDDVEDTRIPENKFAILNAIYLYGDL
jgi:hypothetical protein